MKFARILDFASDLGSRSVFLFGPRQTGKTTLLRDRYPESPWFSLLQGDTFLRLSREPGRMRQELETANPAAGPVIVDEIQKLPSLLDDIHDLIERRGFRFVLTGSSPVKLRRAGTNLLGGRARIRDLFPLVSAEVPDWDSERAMLYGSIPSIYLSEEPALDLEAYCGAYLQLEVQAEGLVRGVEPFSRFLQTAARRAGEQVVYEQIGSLSQVPARTVREFYQVLVDTLIGVMLEPTRLGKAGRRTLVSRGKFYFFDVGVAHALAGTTTLDDHTSEYGRAFEHLIFTELRAWMSYHRDRRPLGFWRTTDGAEVDFIIGDEIAIEVKATRNVTRTDLRGLHAIGEDHTLKRRVMVCREPTRRIVDSIEVVPFTEFLPDMWNHGL